MPLRSRMRSCVLNATLSVTARMTGVWFAVNPSLFNIARMWGPIWSKQKRSSPDGGLGVGFSKAESVPYESVRLVGEHCVPSYRRRDEFMAHSHALLGDRAISLYFQNGSGPGVPGKTT